MRSLSLVSRDFNSCCASLDKPGNVDKYFMDDPKASGLVLVMTVINKTHAAPSMARVRNSFDRANWPNLLLVLLLGDDNVDI